MVDAIIHGDTYNEQIKPANVAVRLLLFAFVVVCVFDPADQVLGAKGWLFLALWGATLAIGLSARDEVNIPIELLACVLLFILVPLLSITWYYLVSGTDPYEGFGLLKSYLLISLAIVLVVNRIDIVPLLSGVLTLLALLTITVSIVLWLEPELFAILQNIGQNTGVLLLNKRNYGSLSFTQVYFVTSPMLAISIPHYFDRAMSSRGRAKLVNFGLSAISIIAMFLVGLRNSMAVALVLPFVLWPLYTRRIALNEFRSLGTLVILALPLVDKLKMFLDPAETSNNTKLSYLSDYSEILHDPLTLLFGQGLGAYYEWSSAGTPGFEKTGANFYFITELTYLELIRNFGVIGAAIMMFLLAYPIVSAFLVSVDRRPRALAVGFLAYLGMCATNPLLFSSLGMLILSAVLANIFQQSDGGKFFSLQRLA